MSGKKGVELKVIKGLHREKWDRVILSEARNLALYRDVGHMGLEASRITKDEILRFAQNDTGLGR